SPVAIDPPSASDYVAGTDHGTLSLHFNKHTPWPPGIYVMVMRGGDAGVKAKDGTPVTQSQIFDLITNGKDLNDPANLGLLIAQTGSLQDAMAQGQQLALLASGYKNSVFALAMSQFSSLDNLAIGATFHVAPTTTEVVVDAASGNVPVPFDLLRDPTSGKL